jgi:hypothetical protein
MHCGRGEVCEGVRWVLGVRGRGESSGVVVRLELLDREVYKSRESASELEHHFYTTTLRTTTAQLQITTKRQLRLGSLLP